MALDIEKMRREIDELFPKETTPEEKRQNIESLLAKIVENTTPPAPKPPKKSELSTRQAAEYVSAFGGRKRLSDDQKQPCFMELED